MRVGNGCVDENEIAEIGQRRLWVDCDCCGPFRTSEPELHELMRYFEGDEPYFRFSKVMAPRKAAARSVVTPQPVVVTPAAPVVAVEEEESSTSLSSTFSNLISHYLKTSQLAFKLCDRLQLTVHHKHRKTLN